MTVRTVPVSGRLWLCSPMYVLVTVPSNRLLHGRLSRMAGRGAVLRLDGCAVRTAR